MGLSNDITHYQFFKKLTQLPFVDAIWLYGSRARGDFKERSDIDLAITCPNASTLEWQQLLDITENADTLLKIDCLRFDQVPNESLKQNIMHDKIVLFDKNTNMMKTVWRQNFDDLGRALDRLGEILEAPLDEQRFLIDGTIQRFEFTIELFWKNFKNLLELEGKEALTPRQAISLAYQTKWFDNEKLWLDMLQDRNMSSHTYKEILADEIYNRIKLYYPEMKTTYNRLKKTYFSGLFNDQV